MIFFLRVFNKFTGICDVTNTIFAKSPVNELDPAAAAAAALRLAFSDCSLLALVELDSSVEQTAFPRSSG